MRKASTGSTWSENQIVGDAPECERIEGDVSGLDQVVGVQLTNTTNKGWWNGRQREATAWWESSKEVALGSGSCKVQTESRVGWLDSKKMRDDQ